jgi:uncharacterized protein (DUF2147 family)
VKKTFYKKEALTSQGFFYFWKMYCRKYHLLLTILFCLPLFAFSQSAIGKWKTIDDNSGEERSIVELFERDGRVYGKIVKLFRKEGEDPDPVCDECDSGDDRHMKKIVGMEIIRNMKKAGNELEDGTILDPESGKVYRCKIWLEGEVLNVRGYWGPFYRTQTWKKVSDRQ